MDFAIQDSSRQLPVKSTTQSFSLLANYSIVQDLCVLSELGTWNDAGDVEGWEDELAMDESDVVQESKFAIKEKRRQERLYKHQAKKSIRAQQKTLGSQPLGIKANAL